MDTSTSGKVQRWSFFLQQFDLEIRSLPGLENLIADWMSRSLPDDSEENQVIDTISVPIFVVNTIRNSIDSPRIPTTAEFIEGYSLMHSKELSNTSIGDNQLRFAPQGGQLFIPTSLRADINYWFHASKYGAHAGINRTIRRMRAWVWWPKLSKDVSEFISCCLICKRFSPSPHASSLLGILSSPTPLELLSLNFVGPRQ